MYTISRCNELNKEHGIHLMRPTVQKVQSSLSLQQANEKECSANKKIQGQLRLERLKKMSSKAAENGDIAEVKGFKYFVPPTSDQTSWEVSSEVDIQVDNWPC